MGDAQKFGKDRDKVYDLAVKAVEKRERALPSALISALHSFSPEQAKSSAERESWGLYKSGILHLKNDAQGGKTGALHEALSRASIRNAALAAGLGIRPPVYARSDFAGMPVHKKGGNEALFLLRRLLEATEADLSISRRLISTALAAHDPLDAFGDTGLFLRDPELAKIAKAAKLKTDSLVPAPDLAAMRRQMVLCFNFLMESYATAGQELRREVDALD